MKYKVTLKTDNDVYDLSHLLYRAETTESFIDYSITITFYNFNIPTQNISADSIMTIEDFSFKVIESGYEESGYFYLSGFLNYPLKELFSRVEIKKGKPLSSQLPINCECDASTSVDYSFQKETTMIDILNQITKPMKTYWVWNKNKVEILKQKETTDLEDVYDYHFISISPKTYQQLAVEKNTEILEKSNERTVLTTSGIKNYSLLQRINQLSNRLITRIDSTICHGQRSYQKIYVF